MWNQTKNAFDYGGGGHCVPIVGYDRTARGRAIAAATAPLARSRARVGDRGRTCAAVGRRC